MYKIKKKIQKILEKCKNRDKISENLKKSQKISKNHFFEENKFAERRFNLVFDQSSSVQPVSEFRLTKKIPNRRKKI